jgi:hypothetical protein
LRTALLSGGENVDDVFDGFVGAVIGGFEAAVGSVLGIGWKRLLASGPHSRLWNNRKSSATWTPFAVRR